MLGANYTSLYVMIAVAYKILQYCKIAAGIARALLIPVLRFGTAVKLAAVHRKKSRQQNGDALN